VAGTTAGRDTGIGTAFRNSVKRSEGGVNRFDFNGLAGGQALATGHETGQADWQSAAGHHPAPHVPGRDHFPFAPFSIRVDHMELELELKLSVRCWIDG
jgi:hypothetical protein